MFRNYVVIALRTLRRQPAYSLLNILGLSVGMACCVLISMYISEELSYDTDWDGADRLYRVALDVQLQDVAFKTAISPMPLAPAFISDFPEVEQATRLWGDPSGKMVVRFENQVYPEPRFFFADSTWFDTFGNSLIRGNPNTALSEPFTVVVTESTARKYFGDADPIGKVLSLREPSDRDIFTYRVTGVMKDMPANSHLAFDFLASLVTQRLSQSQNWLGFGVYSYVKLKKSADPEAFKAKLPLLFKTNGEPQVLERYGMSVSEFEAAGNHYRYIVQPLRDIHLRSNLAEEIKPTSDIRLIYAFAAIAIFVLIVAGVNFVNLSTALASRRGTEVGVRKTMGSNRGQLITQFLVEAVILSMVGLGIALLMTSFVLPYFNEFTGKELSIDISRLGLIVPALLGLGIVMGLSAGAYPALFISAFRPATILKGKSSGRTTSRLRNSLVIFQFSVVTVLIACTAIVFSQTQYLLSKHLGYDQEQVVFFEGAEVMGPQAESFRQTIRSLPGVVSVTNSEQVPGRHFRSAIFQPVATSDDQSLLMEYTYVSFDFVETLGMEITQGRSLSRDFFTDSLGIMLNETAVQQLGLVDPVGKKLSWRGESSMYTIVGILKDFHVTSLHRAIGPVALIGPDPRNTNRPNLIVSARIKTDNWPQTLQAIESMWQRFAPREPFMYSFLDESIAQLYTHEERMSRLITIFAILAVIIACVGLFGLAAYIAEQRTKEIGVRKVLGASETGIFLLLSKDFTRLVAIAVCIAIPISALIMSRWLETFAFSISINPVVFVGSGLISLAIAWMAVSYQSLKAARMNPVRALRHE